VPSSPPPHSRGLPRSLSNSIADRRIVYSTQKNPDDVVITLAIRTPLTKARKGGFKDTHLDGLVFKLLEQVNKKSGLDPQLVEDICMGNVSKEMTQDK
jgi:hypothetical protein